MESAQFSPTLKTFGPTCFLPKKTCPWANIVSGFYGAGFYFYSNLEMCVLSLFCSMHLNARRSGCWLHNELIPPHFPITPHLSSRLLIIFARSKESGVGVGTLGTHPERAVRRAQVINLEQQVTMIYVLYVHGRVCFVLRRLFQINNGIVPRRVRAG
jgi:hypothetical protein